MELRSRPCRRSSPRGSSALVAVLAFCLGRLDDRNQTPARTKVDVAGRAPDRRGARAATWVPGSPGAFPGARSWSGSAALAGNLLLLAVVFSLAVVLQVALEILDHLDGLLAVHAMAGAAALALAAAPGWARDAGLAACGASLGFLCWNRPPARLYLGNAGSLAVATVLPLLFIALPMRGARGFVPDSELVQSRGEAGSGRFERSRRGSTLASAGSLGRICLAAPRLGGSDPGPSPPGGSAVEGGLRPSGPSVGQAARLRPRLLGRGGHGRCRRVSSSQLAGLR